MSVRSSRIWPAVIVAAATGVLIPRSQGGPLQDAQALYNSGKYTEAAAAYKSDIEKHGDADGLLIAHWFKMNME